jgi:hypothetical protein
LARGRVDIFMELFENKNYDNFQLHIKQNPSFSIEDRWNELSNQIEHFEDSCS